jgi:hypothetical protein
MRRFLSIFERRSSLISAVIRHFGAIVVKEIPATLAVVGLLTSLILSSASAQAGKQYPEILVEKTRHDFGEIFAGEELSCSFLVRNVGLTPLELSERKLSAFGNVDRRMRPMLSDVESLRTLLRPAGLGPAAPS